jgi:hypothetical protein
VVGEVVAGVAQRRLQIGTAVLTGIIALSAYAGVVGLVGGAISFGEAIAHDSRSAASFLLELLCWCLSPGR